MYDRQRIEKLIGECRTGFSLPGDLYNDPDVVDFDFEAIFSTSWLQIGLVCELPEPGSYIAMNIGDNPIVILRDQGGEIRGFFNVCRHRGSQICPQGHGKVRRLVCPYHQWTYQLSGELMGAANMQDDFKKGDYPLRPVAVEVCAGVIYICLSETPPDFSAFRAAVEPVLLPHRFDKAKIAYRYELIEYANWKLVMENARECYHCKTSHPTLSQIMPVEATAHFEGLGDLMERFQNRMKSAGLALDPKDGDWFQVQRFPLRDGIISITMDGQPASRIPMCEAEAGDVGSARWALNPHSFAHATGDYAFLFTVFPINRHETRVIGTWIVHEDAVEGEDYDVSRLKEVWDKTNLEDKELAEINQLGVKSAAYSPGPYNVVPEELVIQFTDWYREKATAFLNKQPN